MSQQASYYPTIHQQINESQNELDKTLSKYNNNIDILKHLRSLHELSNNRQNSVISDYKKYNHHSKRIKKLQIKLHHKNMSRKRKKIE